MTFIPHKKLEQLKLVTTRISQILGFTTYMRKIRPTRIPCVKRRKKKGWRARRIGFM